MYAEMSKHGLVSPALSAPTSVPVSATQTGGKSSSWFSNLMILCLGVALLYILYKFFCSHSKEPIKPIEPDLEQFEQMMRHMEQQHPYLPEQKQRNIPENIPEQKSTDMSAYQGDQEQDQRSSNNGECVLPPRPMVQ